MQGILKRIINKVKKKYRNFTYTPIISLIISKLSSIENSKKYFICRPKGGLNDIFNQIEKSCRYCLTYRRKLYVDTTRSGFLDTFNNYFVAPPYITFEEKFGSIEYPASVFPDFLKNNIFDYETEPAGKGGNIYKIKNGPIVDINFKKNYPEQYIIYEKSGGGGKSFNFIRRIRLKDNIRCKIISIIDGLGKYDAVHIRHTDYKTDYKPFLDSLADSIHNKIVVCTDSHEVQQYSIALFGDKLHIVTSIPDTQGETLHYNASLDRYSTNVDSLVDLFILASSDKLYFSKTTKGKGKMSGFGKLARYLHGNKKVVKRLLYSTSI